MDPGPAHFPQVPGRSVPKQHPFPPDHSLEEPGARRSVQQAGGAHQAPFVGVNWP